MSQDERRWELDALRGLMLVLMTLTHLPTQVSDPAGQPLGFVSAAEGFVLLSAYMAGMVYSEKAYRQGEAAMKSAFFNRALKLYACQLALLLFAFTVIAGIGLVTREDSVTGLLGFFLEKPMVAVVSASLLLYNPALLDILPIYIVFMLISPVILLHGMEHGWRGVLLLSLLVWLGAQFGLGPALFHWATGWFSMPLRYQDLGAFEILAWQFLWVLGLWMGAMHSQPDHSPTRFPRWMVMVALAGALTAFLWRHAVGQTPLPGNPGINLLFDKWQLGPLRLINVLALLLLAMHFAPTLKRWLPRVPVLETLGKAALPVFCAHLVLALLGLAVFGAARPERPWSVDLLILFVGFYGLWVVARLSMARDRRLAARRARALRAAQKTRLRLSGALQSPVATGHSLRR
ncbi:OpgC domain-containing protein [Hydrogenophaga sp. IBVHS1]|uniref:OpgC domain-containing protein n=1 Tax=unclassified Hydrogenophaga TaxID=2610897 RepID=UPI000A2E572C|nr:OpgC domain-containing protein [Hydrogenophaga sp. IBVHS1]OSZ75373.1 acyltransferase [Hydrogenophaga sp. IBVHS1]